MFRLLIDWEKGTQIHDFGILSPHSLHANTQPSYIQKGTRRIFDFSRVFASSNFTWI